MKRKIAKMKTLLILFFITSSILYTNNTIIAQSYNDIYDTLFTSLDFLPNSNVGRTTFPLLNISSGGRSESFGTAFTALADNITYLEANPAGGSMLKKTEFGVFHNNLIADVSSESIFFTTRANHLSFGTGLKFLHFDFTRFGSRGEQLASSIYSEGVMTFNTSYNFIPSFYFEGISLGANLKAAYRSVPDILVQDMPGIEPGSQSSIGFMLDIGVLTRFNFLKAYTARDKNFSLGAVLLHAGPPVNNEPLPTRLSAGLAYRPLRYLQFTGDYIIPINFVDLNESESHGFSLGIGVQAVQFLSINGGFLLIGGNPRMTIGTEIVLDTFLLHINYTLDRTTQVGSLDRFSFQLSLNLGDRGRKTIQEKVDDLYLQALLALSQSEYLQVIQFCEQALRLDPGFTPARETLLTAQNSYNLEQELERLRRAN